MTPTDKQTPEYYQWVKASERLPDVKDYKEWDIVIFKNIEIGTDIIPVLPHITPNIKALLSNKGIENFEWLEKAQASIPSASPTTAGESKEGIINKGIVFANSRNTDNESYRSGAGFGYSCGYEDAMNQYASLSTPSASFSLEVVEKARELVEKFWPFVEHTTDGFHDKELEKENSKQCALISIDREIEVVNRLLATGLNNDFDLLRERGELQQVRHQIQSM